ncbi:Rot1p Ecym_2124 [Eremothecium cymbalariae DBVPG|uniref:Protein ROT1 n=1 Tax=Eremothecium cymbalariae (strain CBS 270.75 / DBVPG 7215 / KCTC 17166 / NRRL Y-17582) TaxID=931890 RepID=G8JNG1_ERECY|nr:Hypothetical protein Ecym_2124 [Eremothecium cymbalariae DBVPG\
MVSFGSPGFAVLCVTFLTSLVRSQSASDLYGTWSSKSNQVFTGPGFFDPTEELLIEPSLPGISYSFTEDGFFEEASYRVVGNARDHKCPTAVMTFQHGTYKIEANGTLVLTPFGVDGRQLVSEPCKDGGKSTYVRYNQVETFNGFTVQIDPYHGKYTLQLYQFDGAPLQPLYLAYRPPQMLPTTTLNPTEAESPQVTDSSGNKFRKRSLRELVRRGLENKYKTNAVKKNILFDEALCWKIGASLIGLGSLIFFLV